VLRTTGDAGGKNPDCTELRKLFDSLPDIPQGTAVTGTVDKTLGGILGASA
jgi:phospholipid/cholesterol/gamma-HCH transport system substrate-binding protein